MRVWPGSPYPLGATSTGNGVNFAVFSEHASAVQLELFASPSDAAPTHSLKLRERTNHVWHCFLPDVRAGQAYGYRVHGPYDPAHGHRMNPHKLLVDPYAKALHGSVQWNDTVFGFPHGSPLGELAIDTRDDAASVPKTLVVDDAFPWGDDRAPRTPWNRTVIYECHVRGFTKLHPAVPEPLRGTYLGLACEPVIEHLKALGVTAIELLPVHQFISERPLVDRGLANYWGYNTLGFFAPHAGYATRQDGAQVTEFKAMVKALHAAGLEVILDVVYNHTAEQGPLGPTLSLRGFDNAAYYRLVPGNARLFEDFTGCGNTIDTRHPRALQLVLDSLRYWVNEMHVDGFRFDLAPCLAREPHEFNPNGRFFTTVQQDPVLQRVKLIAEPWDLGANGYQVGNFPGGFTEWNGKYRDALRAFWRGDTGRVAELASRLSGNSDIYSSQGGSPPDSVNFVTCHDGFTLSDLTSYEHKHNELNGENNQDGSEHNLSRNWGVEGPTDDPELRALRARVMRNLMACLAFSQGVPMLSMGDEVCRSQAGNNNAYCQDNELGWMSWQWSPEQLAMLGFTRHVLALRRENPVLRRKSFFTGNHSSPHMKDVTWLRRDGREMTHDDWHDETLHELGMLIDGEATDDVDEHGEPVRGNTLLLLVNASQRNRLFRLPSLPGAWLEEVHTARAASPESQSGEVSVPSYALVLLRHQR